MAFKQKRKIILIVIDGLGDKPMKELGNKTPLEAAKTPNLDWLAQNGICGQIQPFCFSWQKYPFSDTAHLALFGYNPEIYYLGRGVYEVAGIGMKMQEGDVAFRANFGTVNENFKVTDRRAGRINGTEPLVRALQGVKINGVNFLIKKSYGHRAGLILRSSKNNKKLSNKISDGDPHEIEVRVKKILPLDNSRKAKFTADVLNKFLEKAHRILTDHPLNTKREKQGKLPANYLLIRGAGILRKTISFKEKYNLRAACIAGGALYKGIAKILGMDEISVKGANGFVTTNLKGKFLATKKALKKYNFIFLHIKAADSLAEDGNFRGKKDFIEKIDENLKPVFKKIKNTLIIVTADHSTCSNLKRHCAVPIPILIYGSRVDKVKKLARLSFARQKLGGFSEKACKKGKLGRIRQLSLMSKILYLQ